MKTKTGNNIVDVRDLKEISNAYELLDTLGVEDHFSIDPFNIAEKLGIKIDQSLTMESMADSGSITRHGDDVRIWVNPIDPESRQRFTVAHELGHYINDILPNNVTEFVDTPETMYRSGGADKREVAANKFAAMLLMPKDAVLSAADDLISARNGSIPTRELIGLLATKFTVSKSAMIVRLKVLGVIPNTFSL